MKNFNEVLGRSLLMLLLVSFGLTAIFMSSVTTYFKCASNGNCITFKTNLFMPGRLDEVRFSAIKNPCKTSCLRPHNASSAINDKNSKYRLVLNNSNGRTVLATYSKKFACENERDRLNNTLSSNDKKLNFSSPFDYGKGIFMIIGAILIILGLCIPFAKLEAAPEKEEIPLSEEETKQRLAAGINVALNTHIKAEDIDNTVNTINNISNSPLARIIRFLLR